MPVIINTVVTTPAPVTEIIKYAVTEKTCDFDFERLEELVDLLEEESDGRMEAKVNLVDGCVAITVVNKDDGNIAVYYAENNKDLYQSIDSKYLENIDLCSSGNDFWDRWSAVVEALEGCKLVDDIFAF